MKSEYNDCCFSSTTILVGRNTTRVVTLNGMETLAKRLERAMDEARLTQNALAVKASRKSGLVSQQVVQHLLSGRNKTSKHLPAIAEALGKSVEYLVSGREPATKGHEALIVGYVGAGAEVFRFEEGVVLESIEAPPGVGRCNAARVRGDSMPPFRDGWLIFYGAEHQGVPDDAVGRLAVVGLADGHTLIKELHRGSKRGFYDLVSWNAPLRKDQKVIWAARVFDIRPT